MNLKIGICYHKEYPIYNLFKNKDIYLPIFGGKQLYTGNSQFLNNMQGDNTGDNISYLNKNINEISVIYWLATHLNQLNNPDFIGLFHYRRCLWFDVNELQNNVILAHKQQFSISVKNQLCGDIQESLINFYINLYTTFFPEQKILLDEFFNKKQFYARNMFIMPINIFKQYIEFLKFNIKLCDIIISYNYNRCNTQRALGFLLQRMTGFFIFKMSKKGIIIKNKNILMV